MCHGRDRCRRGQCRSDPSPAADTLWGRVPWSRRSGATSVTGGHDDCVYTLIDGSKYEQSGKA